MIDVVMRDGRTMYRFACRGDLQRLTIRTPKQLDAHPPVPCWTRQAVEGDEWRRTNLMFVNAFACASVARVDADERNAFDEAQAAERAPLMPPGVGVGV